MAKKMIKITENQLMELIRETVQDTLNRLETINEMAVPLKRYKARVDGLRFQLVENWCLCKYCQLYNKDNQNFAHWIKELKACINNLKFLDIKGSVNKRATIVRMLINDYDYNNANMIYRITNDKFNAENVIDEQQKITVCSEFAKHIEQLIDVIAINSISTDVYIQEQFSDVE